MSIIINSNTYKASSIKIVDGKIYSGSYPFQTETLTLLSRGKQEGFNLPNFNSQVTIDVLIQQLKSHGIWQQLDVYYNFSYNDTSLADFSRINWKSPFSALATKNGGMAYTNQGWEGNGVDGYIDTNYLTSVSSNYKLSGATIGGYVYKANTAGGVSGRIACAIDTDRMTVINTSTTRHRINTASNTSVTVNLSGLGYKITTKDNTPNARYHYNNSTLTSTTTPTDTADGNNRRLGLFASVSTSVYGNHGLSTLIFGGFLSETQVGQFQSSYNNYLSRL
ncbi:hypothetical protein [Flavobacterium sp.]|uniref:hypothetical protein n=1 Tax=Flavobacterium sp. TaxID=239 RepID=UPI004034DA48